MAFFKNCWVKIEGSNIGFKKRIYKGKILACWLALLLSITLLTGCTQSSQAEDAQSTPAKTTEQEVAVDKAPQSSQKKTEHKISTDEGAVLSVPCGENARLDISLPQGAMENDTLLELMPMENSPGEGWIAAGFYLNEKGKNGVDLKFHAAISYVTSGELPENACIVKYTDDGKSYKPVPSQRFKKGSENGLIAFVDSFSGYGVKIITATEIEVMADEMEKTGLVWVLSVNDKDSFTEGNSEDGISGETFYEATLDMTLVNTESPTPFVMQGLYRGAARMESYAKVTIEGFPMGFTRVEANDDNASITLYPVFEEYEPEPGSGLPTLVGFVPIRYEGSGVLHMKSPKDLGDTASQDGINLMEVARQMESEWGLDLPDPQNEDIPFSIVTDGPMAYVTLNLKGERSVTLTGSIVGRAKGQQIEPVSLVPDEKKSEAPVEKSEITCRENADGSYDYDYDGDGETDFTLYPLITK